MTDYPPPTPDQVAALEAIDRGAGTLANHELSRTSTACVAWVSTSD